MSSENCSLVAFICWNLWLNQNSVVWSSKPGTADSVLTAASTQLSAWKVAHVPAVAMRAVGLLEEDGKVRWTPPKMGILKANVDAANFSNGAGTGVGIIVRDWEGKVVQARQVRFPGCVNPRSAEAMGIREALSWLKGIPNLIIESDALEVILEIRNPNLIEVDTLVDDCIHLAKQFSNVIFVFVSRSANQAAHSLAQNARSISGHQEWYCHFPEFLTCITALEL